MCSSWTARRMLCESLLQPYCAGMLMQLAALQRLMQRVVGADLAFILCFSLLSSTHTCGKTQPTSSAPGGNLGRAR
jgi:hypothetical protein